MLLLLLLLLLFLFRALTFLPASIASTHEGLFNEESGRLLCTGCGETVAEVRHETVIVHCFIVSLFFFIFFPNSLRFFSSCYFSVLMLQGKEAKVDVPFEAPDYSTVESEVIDLLLEFFHCFGHKKDCMRFVSLHL
jgi:hypothetical protein